MPATKAKRRATPAPDWSVRYPLQPDLWGRTPCRWSQSFADLIRVPIRTAAPRTVTVELAPGKLAKLCRRTLERRGRVFHKKTGRTFFVSELLAADAPDFPPPRLHPALRQLGLEPGCATSDVHRRYRALARTAHPDAGGSADAFKALRAVYETALRVLGGGK